MDDQHSLGFGQQRGLQLHQRHSRSVLLAHIVWSTQDRRALIGPQRDTWLTTVLSRKAAELGSRLLAVGCATDHVHVVARYPSPLSLADLVQGLKGASCHAWNVEVVSGPKSGATAGLDVESGATRLRWQVGFWAESVGVRGLNCLLTYVAHQREHHARGTLHGDWEAPRFGSQSSEAAASVSRPGSDHDHT